MSKKGQSISINTIIIAAIALAVLVVLFAIFTGRLGGFTKGVQETDTCTQKCSSLNLQPSYIDFPDTECRPPAQVIAGTYSDVQKAGRKYCCCS